MTDFFPTKYHFARPPTVDTEDSPGHSWRKRLPRLAFKTEAVTWSLAVLQVLANSNAEFQEIQRLQGATSLKNANIHLEDQRSLGKIISLSEEPNREMFFRGLLSFARDLQSQGREAQAIAIFQMLDQETVVEPIRDQARKDLEAITGRTKAIPINFLPCCIGWILRIIPSGPPLRNSIPPIPTA